MRFSIYRSTTCTMYPEETMSYRYGFQPITKEEWTREGLLLGWIKDSGSEPFAIIETPDGSRVAETENGWELLLPDAAFGICADEAYDLAKDQTLGLWVVSESRPQDRVFG